MLHDKPTSLELAHDALLLHLLMANVGHHHDSATASTVLIPLALASQLDIQTIGTVATLRRASQKGTDTLPALVMPTAKASRSTDDMRHFMRHSVIDETLGVLGEYVEVEGDTATAIRKASGIVLIIEGHDRVSHETVVFGDDATGQFMDFLDLGDDGSFEFDLIHGCLPLS